MVTARDALPGVRLAAARRRRGGLNAGRLTIPPLREDFDAADYRVFARRSNEDPIPRPLALHVSVPSRDGGRAAGASPEHPSQDLALLEQEIALQAALFDPDRVVVALHVDAAAAPQFDAAALARLTEALGRAFRLDPGQGRDFSLTLDARFVPTGLLKRAASLGFNRASLLLREAGAARGSAARRFPTLPRTREAIVAAYAARLPSVGVEIACGTPATRRDRLARLLEALAELRADRIVLAGAPPARLAPAARTLTAARYRHIGRDHFALASDPLARAFDAGTLRFGVHGYATQGACDHVGLGPAAFSRVEDCCAQNARRLADRTRHLAAGRLPIVRGVALDAEDRLRAEVVESVMCRGGVNFTAIEHRHAIRFLSHFRREVAALAPFVRDDLVYLDDMLLAATERGRLHLNEIAGIFALRRPV